MRSAFRLLLGALSLRFFRGIAYFSLQEHRDNLYSQAFFKHVTCRNKANGYVAVQGTVETPTTRGDATFRFQERTQQTLWPPFIFILPMNRIAARRHPLIKDKNQLLNIVNYANIVLSTTMPKRCRYRTLDGDSARGFN